MSDSIYRHEAIKTITSYNGVVDKSVAKRLLLQMPSAEPQLSNDSPKLDNENGELIYRQDAVKTMYDLCEDIDDESLHIDVIVDALENLPFAEPKIIHCKDCKYWTHINRTNRYWCKTDDGLFDLNPLPDDFCSRAKRRTG